MGWRGRYATNPQIRNKSSNQFPLCRRHRKSYLFGKITQEVPNIVLVQIPNTEKRRNTSKYSIDLRIFGQPS